MKYKILLKFVLFLHCIKTCHYKCNIHYSALHALYKCSVHHKTIIIELQGYSNFSKHSNKHLNPEKTPAH